MREKRMYAVVTFHSTHEAMAMEEYARKHQIPGRLIPVPTIISAGCGLAWRMPVEDFRQFAVETTGLEYEAMNELFL